MLLSMGVPPKVSSATGMYMVTFSTFSACIIYMFAGDLDLDYALWIGSWSTLGSIIGLFFSNLYMKKNNR